MSVWLVQRRRRRRTQRCHELDSSVVVVKRRKVIIGEDNTEWQQKRSARRGDACDETRSIPFGACRCCRHLVIDRIHNRPASYCTPRRPCTRSWCSSPETATSSDAAADVDDVMTETKLHQLPTTPTNTVSCLAISTTLVIYWWYGCETQIIPSDQGGGKCVCPRICLSVCLSVSNITQQDVKVIWQKAPHGSPFPG